MFTKRSVPGWIDPDRRELVRLRDHLVAAGVDRYTYLISRLDRALAGGMEDGSLYCWPGEAEEPPGCLFVGDDHNLAMSTLVAKARAALGPQVCRLHRGVAIAVSPPEEIEVLIAALAGQVSTLLHRRQVLYAVDREGFNDPGPADLVPAAGGDVPRLVEAAIGLAMEDLSIPRWRMSPARIERTVRRRLAHGRTFVIRREGRVVFKVDVAVRTREALLIEGVYTFPECRNQGLAVRGMGAMLGLALAEHPRANLHVGRDNPAARRVYERAGMAEVDELGLVLFRPWR